MMDTLLVEIRTEELPPKALARLGRAFAEALHADLRDHGLAVESSAVLWFATPRRLAAQITDVVAVAADKVFDAQGPSLKAGLDSQGRPTPALQGFARKHCVAPESLQQRDTPKGPVFVYSGTAPGVELAQILAGSVGAALKSLPVPKLMRWGSGEAEFVRPAHGLIMLHGSHIVPGCVLGLESGATTLGHRFLTSGPIRIPHADAYEQVMREHGRVIASWDTRRAAILTALDAAAGAGAAFEQDDSLLDEVTALTEAPVVYGGTYSADFLAVPQECLVLSMKQHQKYFPLVDAESRALIPRFLVVSNLETADPTSIVQGNERVLRARLSDARFFFEQDQRIALADRVPQLASVVYHNRLGTQLERVGRVAALAVAQAHELGADATEVERAARLAKADLMSAMVGEFPELQGIMGRYYALHDGEGRLVADAIEAHYRPRFAGDTIPESPVGRIVALADKLDMLAGLFAIGQQPTGEKDPFALRRQALGVVRILAEAGLPLELDALVRAAFAPFPKADDAADAQAELMSFLHERMRGYFSEAAYSAAEIDAVLALRPKRVDLIPRWLEAVRIFNTLPEAPSLAAANKRIGNILRKAGTSEAAFETGLLVEAGEKQLSAEFERARREADARYAAQDYAGMLKALASLKAPVDAFFDDVMVMADDARLRQNRIALLAQLQRTMNRIADISKLAA